MEEKSVELSDEVEELQSAPGVIAALARAQARFEPVKKTKTADAGRYSYSYASLDDVLAGCLPALNAEGIVLTQDVRLDAQAGWLGVTLQLSRMDERIEFGPLDMPLPENPTPQQIGSAETYARRYQIQAALGIAAEEDDDAVIARAAEPAPEQPKAPRRLSRGQMQKLRELAAAKGQSEQNVVDWVGRHLGLATLAELDTDGWSALMGALQQLPDAAIASEPEEPEQAPSDAE